MQPIDLGYHPRPWQLQVHANLKRFSVLVVHRRGGKTVLSVMTLIDAALRTTKQQARYAYVAPFRNQAKAIAWDYLRHYAGKIPGVKINEGELWVELPNGARIRLFGADNADAMRGLYFDGIVLDEVADIEPDVWGLIIRPALSDRKGWALFIGTPKGINLFSELYWAALKDQDWYAGLWSINETKVLDAREVDLAKSSMSENQFKQEFLCDFNAAVDNALITIDTVLQATGKHLKPECYNFAAKILGVDVARYGGDRSVIFPRQGLAAFKPKIFSSIGNMDLAAHVAESWDQWQADACFIDAGRGEGVIDRLIQLGYNPIPVDFGSTRTISPSMTNRRSEMWHGMAEWLKAGAAIPDIPELRADLCAPTYTWANARGKFQLESKDDMKERGLPSPDIGDALALTFAAPVQPRASGIRAVQQQQRREYDPMHDA